MTTSMAPGDGVEICYETFGDPADPALLMVNGFTAQMINFDERLCRHLAGHGRFVIRYDNRDTGLSTHLDGVEVDLGAVLAAAAGKGDMPAVPYTLSHMAADGMAVLDHLGIGSAHVFGTSMGGMIVQTMAIEHPARVATLTSVMSTTNEPGYFESDPTAMKALMTPPPTEREAFIAATVERNRLFSSPRYYDPKRAAVNAAAAYDRAFYPEGALRQMAAIRASGHRGEQLPKLHVPTLVIHGRADTLILPPGGERTAELIPGANLLFLGDMGHDMPEPLWPTIVAAVIAHTG